MSITLLTMANAQQLSQCPPTTVLTGVYQAAATTSTSIAIGPKSDLLEVTAINDGCFVLFGAGTVTTSNFHAYVAAGTTRHYNINVGTTAIQVLSTTGSVVVITY